MNLKTMILICVFLASFAARADYHCTGKVVHFGLSDSKLNISNGFGVHRLCNLTEDYCKAWMSAAMAAKMTEAKLIIYYRDSSIGGDQSNGVCSQIGDWVTPSDTPYYMRLP